jgi:hypothetical protein
VVNPVCENLNEKLPQGHQQSVVAISCHLGAE